VKNMRTCDQAQKAAPFGIAPAPGECKGLKATEPRVSPASLRTANRDALSAADEAMIALTALFSSPQKKVNELRAVSRLNGSHEGAV